jgi:hypothetical protein
MRRITRTCYWLVGALVAALAGLALTAPTTAKAAVSVNVNGDTLTVTSDQEADTITLAAAGGFNTVNRQATTLAADDNAKIIVNAGDGADTVDASALGTGDYSALTVNGGNGDDLLTGGSDNDHLLGGGGNDRVIGFRSNDDLEGGDGNDVLVWNNGDNTDVMDGGAGADEVEVNGAPTAGDVFTAVPNAGRVLFTRTNLVPFTVDFSAERLTVNGLGGDDTFNVPFTVDFDAEALTVDAGGGDDQFTVSPGLPGLLVTADGGSGNDSLTGAEEADSLVGGAGNDTLTGGGGSDLLDGQDGDDRLLARDGHGDLVRGGAGKDSAQTDAITVDAIDGVETIDATPSPPAPDTTALLPILGHITVVRSHGHLIARVPLSCPAAETSGCQTTVTLTTARTIRLGRVRAMLVLGSNSVSLRGGKRRTLSIPLAAGVATLARHGRFRPACRSQPATRQETLQAARSRPTCGSRASQPLADKTRHPAGLVSLCSQDARPGLERRRRVRPEARPATEPAACGRRS